MSLWNPLNRAMVIAAGVSVLAACYAVAAWGQGAQFAAPGTSLPNTPTVTVSSLLVPPAAWRHFEKAKSAADHHHDDEFERESAKALEIAPGFADMYLLRATVQAGAHEYEAAVASALAAARVDPGAMWTTVVLAGAYNGLQRFNDALLVLNANHGFESETWQAMYERARAETGVHNSAAALHWSAMVLRVAPQDFADIHLVRANALILCNRLSEAAGQTEIYLQSKGPLRHRAEAVVLRDVLKDRMSSTNRPVTGLVSAAGAGAEARQQAQPELAGR